MYLFVDNLCVFLVVMRLCGHFVSSFSCHLTDFQTRYIYSPIILKLWPTGPLTFWAHGYVNK